jgi:pilus assembly protein CpaC
MKLILLLLLLLPLCITFENSYAQNGEKVLEIDEEIPVGTAKRFKLKYIYHRDVEAGDDSIIDVKLEPHKKRFQITGLRKGKTYIIFSDAVGRRKTQYNFIITADDKSKKAAEIRELLGDVEGLEISVKGGRIIIGGKIVVPSDVGRIEAVLGDNAEVLRLYELSPLTQMMIAKKMQEEIVNNGMKQVAVRVVNKVYWVEGVVASEDQKKMIQKIVEGYLPVKVKDLYQGTDRADSGSAKSAYQLLLTINAKKQKQPPEKLVKVTAQFVELSKDYTKVFAFKWAPLMSDDNSQISFGRTASGDVSSKSSGTLSGVISNLFPKLKSAKNAGYARVIQSGMLVIKNNKQGKINKQTETPFSVGSGEFSRAKTSSIGFSMDATPRVLEDEKVELALGVTVKIPSGQTATGEPVTATNTLSTIVIVKSKQSAVVGGVVQNQTITQYDKDDPAPTDVTSGSPLFFFMRSKSYNTAKNQFVIFVTPEILESASTGTDQIRRKFRRRTR